jgi:hypothetical protein
MVKMADCRDALIGKIMRRRRAIALSADRAA